MGAASSGICPIISGCSRHMHPGTRSSRDSRWWSLRRPRLGTATAARPPAERRARPTSRQTSLLLPATTLGRPSATTMQHQTDGRHGRSVTPHVRLPRFGHVDDITVDDRVCHFRLTKRNNNVVGPKAPVPRVRHNVTRRSARCVGFLVFSCRPPLAKSFPVVVAIPYSDTAHARENKQQQKTDLQRYHR